MLNMPNIDPFDSVDLYQFEINLNIPAFLRAAVRKNLKRDSILVYLHFVGKSPMATQKMRRFAVIAPEEALTRNEILVWLHLSYGGSAKPEHISQKLRIPPCFAEKALAVLVEKGIIKNGKAL